MNDNSGLSTQILAEMHLSGHQFGGKHSYVYLIFKADLVNTLSSSLSITRKKTLFVG